MHVCCEQDFENKSAENVALAPDADRCRWHSERSGGAAGHKQVIAAPNSILLFIII
jgi:hypothetical protein